MDQQLQRQLLALARIQLETPEPAWVQQLPRTKERKVWEESPEECDFFLHYVFHALKLSSDRAELYVDYMAEATNKSGQESLTELNLSFNPSIESLEIHRISTFRDGNWYAIDQEDLFSYPIASENQDKVLSNQWCVHPVLNQSIKGSRVRFTYTIQTDLRQTNNFYSEAYSPLYKPCGWYQLCVLLSDAEVKRRFQYSGEFSHHEEETDFGLLHLFDLPVTQLPTFEPGTLRLQELNENLFLTTIPSWNHLGQWMEKEIQKFQLQLNDLPRTLKSIIEEADPSNRDECVRKVVYWVAQNINYFSLTLERSGYLPRNPKDVFRKGWGDCKDKSLACKFILDLLGIESHLALLNTDLVARKEFPLPGFFFNHCVLWIGTPEDGYPVDPTSIFQIDLRCIPDFSRTILFILDGINSTHIEVQESKNYQYSQKLQLKVSTDLEEPVLEVIDQYFDSACGQIIQGLQNDSQGFYHNYRMHLQEHFSGEISALSNHSEVNTTEQFVKVTGQYKGFNMLRLRAGGKKIIEWRAWLIYSLLGKYFSSLQRNLPLVTEMARVEEVLEWEGCIPIGNLPPKLSLENEIVKISSESHQVGNHISMRFLCEMKPRIIEAHLANQIAQEVQTFLETNMSGTMSPVTYDRSRIIYILLILIPIIALILLKSDFLSYFF